MRKFIYFIAMMLVVTGFYGCQSGSDDVDDGTNPNPTLVIGSASISIFENGLACDSKSRTQTIDFTTNVAWTAKSSVAWATVTPNSGVAGSSAAVIQIEENVYKDTRTAIITIKADTKQETFTITQTGKFGTNPDDDVPDPEGTISMNLASGSSLSGVYIRDGNFTGRQFVSLGKMKGLGNVSYIPKSGWAPSLAVMEGHGYIAYLNPYYFGSGDYIRMFVVSHSASSTLIKYQTPFLGSETAITPEKATVSFEQVQSNQTVPLLNSYLYPFSVSSDMSWCSVSTVSQTANVPPDAISITVSDSPEPESRTANVVISSPGREDVAITVTQAGIGFWVLGPNKGASFTIDIKSNLSWRVSSDTSWCTVSPNEGSSDQAVTISATENTGIKRAAIVTVSVSDDIKQTITVSQLGLDNVRLGNLLICDRNVGSSQDGTALNYTNDTNHPDHKNSTFKGGYYTWSQAKTACSGGWRLPTRAEFDIISSAMKFSNSTAYIDDDAGNRCYFPLSGYSSRPSNVCGSYWSSTEHSSDDRDAWYFDVNTTNSDVNGYWSNVSNGFSVRCVKTAD